MTSGSRPYQNQCSLPFILYPPQMYKVNDGDAFAHYFLGLKESIENYVLYLSVPFCRVQCYACPYFVTLLSEADPTNLEDRYVNALIKDMKKWATYPRFEKGHLQSVYIGGGTGSILKTENLKRIVDTVSDCFPLADEYDFTLEGNARDFDEEKIAYVGRSKINRVSLGVQSFDAAFLEVIGAPHEAEQSITTVKALQAQGINNINVDVMYNVPNHTEAVLQRDLHCLGELNVNHVTAYAYRVHRDTKQEKRIKSGQVNAIHKSDSVAVQRLHAMLCHTLEGLGFKQYMFDHFAKPGRESKYQYWTFKEGVDALGIGAGAYSFINNYRAGSSKKVEKYLSTVEAGSHFIVSASRHLNVQYRKERYVIFSFQYFFIDYDAYTQKFKSAFLDDFRDVVERLERKGLVARESDRLVMSELGKQWRMNVLLEFINDECWGDQEAKKEPNWAMNISMVDLTAENKKFWLGAPSESLECLRVVEVE
ncbi:MAG: coproporphyrinogen-III oxidase family protein [Gammaproteobacteria bacterium]